MLLDLELLLASTCNGHFTIVLVDNRAFDT